MPVCWIENIHECQGSGHLTYHTECRLRCHMGWKPLSFFWRGCWLPWQGHRTTMTSILSRRWWQPLTRSIISNQYFLIISLPLVVAYVEVVSQVEGNDVDKRAWNSGFNSGMGKRAWNSKPTYITFQSGCLLFVLLVWKTIDNSCEYFLKLSLRPFFQVALIVEWENVHGTVSIVNIINALLSIKTLYIYI